jgi:uncharacterized protein (DUF302 family)
MSTFSNAINASFEDAVLATKDALKRHGFEVLTEIDMRRAFKRHLGVDFRPYLILSAYSPTVAHRAVHLCDEIGSVLLCNVVVQQQNDHVHISAADPAAYCAMNHVELNWIIQKIRNNLQTAIEEIEAKPARRSYLPEREEAHRRSASKQDRSVGLWRRRGTAAQGPRILQVDFWREERDQNR